MNKTVKLAGGAVALAVLMTAWTGTADAKRARCYTTDDGYYSCNFRGIDDAGSFRISAPGYPTFTLEVIEPGLRLRLCRLRQRQRVASRPVCAQPRRRRLLEQP